MRSVWDEISSIDPWCLMGIAVLLSFFEAITDTDPFKVLAILILFPSIAWLQDKSFVLMHKILLNS